MGWIFKLWLQKKASVEEPKRIQQLAQTRSLIFFFNFLIFKTAFLFYFETRQSFPLICDLFKFGEL